MHAVLQKYVNRTAEIIYIDRQGRFSKRLIELRSLTSEHAVAYCYERKALRLFKISNILAILPKGRSAV